MPFISLIRVYVRYWRIHLIFMKLLPEPVDQLRSLLPLPLPLPLLAVAATAPLSFRRRPQCQGGPLPVPAAGPPTCTQRNAIFAQFSFLCPEPVLANDEISYRPGRKITRFY
eukprot:COSAG06_NODE_1301_length_9938_cov_49.846834_14_plen_112_part_00